MMQKTLMIRFCKVCSLLLALAAAISFLQEFFLCRADNNRERIKDFYLEEQDSLDVVFIGASEVYAGFASAYAYSSYGFTSYPIATQSNTVLNYLTCVKEAVRTQHPGLLVIEVNGALYDDDMLDKEVNMRRIADNIPNNANKRALTEGWDYDLTDDYLPIMKYHAVWEDYPIGLEWSTAMLLTRMRGHNLLKGVTTTTKTYSGGEKLYNTGDVKPAPLNTRCSDALDELLAYCREEKLNVLFVRFPHLVNLKGLKRMRRSLTVADRIRESGFGYIGMDELLGEIGLEPERDFYDTEHVNIYGQKKLTDWLCRRIVSRLGARPDRLSDSTRREWEDSAKQYEAFCALAEHILEKGDEVVRVAEDILSMFRMREYLK